MEKRERNRGLIRGVERQRQPIGLQSTDGANLILFVTTTSSKTTELHASIRRVDMLTWLEMMIPSLRCCQHASLPAYSAPPDPLAVFKGPTSKVKEGEGEERREREGEGRGKGRGRGG